MKHMMVLCVKFPRSDCPVSNSCQSRPKKQPKINLVAEIFASLNNTKMWQNILKLQGSKVILSNLTAFWSWVPFSTFEEGEYFCVREIDVFHHTDLQGNFLINHHWLCFRRFFQQLWSEIFATIYLSIS